LRRFAVTAHRQDSSRESEIKTLQAKVGELIVERDFLAKSFDRCAWIEGA